MPAETVMHPEASLIALSPGALSAEPSFCTLASAGRKAAVGGVVLQALARTDERRCAWALP